MSRKMELLFAVAAVIGISLAGCGQPVKPGAANVEPKTEVSGDGHNHDGWWCDEHGIPEKICTQCDLKLTAEYKAKGDWCDKHDRADSQCFVCHTEKAAEFAAEYAARYGKQPPPRVSE